MTRLGHQQVWSMLGDMRSTLIIESGFPNLHTNYFIAYSEVSEVFMNYIGDDLYSQF